MNLSHGGGTKYMERCCEARRGEGLLQEVTNRMAITLKSNKAYSQSKNGMFKKKSENKMPLIKVIPYDLDNCSEFL